jgi:hypothetical protein
LGCLNCPGTRIKRRQGKLSEKASGIYKTKIVFSIFFAYNIKRYLLTIKGRNGRIRSKDTIKPGNDPCPPKDKEH